MGNRISFHLLLSLSNLELVINTFLGYITHSIEVIYTWIGFKLPELYAIASCISRFVKLLQFCLMELHYKIVTLSTQIISKGTYGHVIV